MLLFNSDQVVIISGDSELIVTELLLYFIILFCSLRIMKQQYDYCQ